MMAIRFKVNAFRGIFLQNLARCLYFNEQKNDHPAVCRKRYQAEGLCLKDAV